MSSSSVYIGYVRDEDGAYYLQVPHDSPFGFALLSDDQIFPGGVGIPPWRAVPPEEVPQDVRARMDWILENA